MPLAQSWRTGAGGSSPASRTDGGQGCVYDTSLPRTSRRDDDKQVRRREKRRSSGGYCLQGIIDVRSGRSMAAGGDPTLIA